jgi:DNA-binding transcriptional ArsR family regulator
MPRKAAEPSQAGLIAIHECLRDETRLRIVHLLLRGRLCVGDFQEIVRRPQVFISKHLAYLRGKGLVRAERFQNWMIYSLPKPLSGNWRRTCAACKRARAGTRFFGMISNGSQNLRNGGTGRRSRRSGKRAQAKRRVRAGSEQGLRVSSSDSGG